MLGLDRQFLTPVVSMKAYCQEAFSRDFPHYLKITLDRLSAALVQAKIDPSAFIKYNLPFEWPPTVASQKRRGVLLIHGFLASPYVMRGFARAYQAKGYQVRSLLLPGHGTVSGDLLQVRLEDWQRAVEFGIRSFSDEVSEIHLCGYSLGAALAVLAQAPLKSCIKSLTLLSPAFELSFWAIFLPVLRFLKPSHWFSNPPEFDKATYHFFPATAAYEVYLATRQVQQWLKKNSIDIPCFIALSQEDKTVLPKAVMRMFSRHLNPKSRLVLYSKHPKQLTDTRVSLIDSNHAKTQAGPWKHVVDISHIAIPVLENDPYYGRAGEFNLGLSAETYWGEDHWRNRRYQPFARLVFNPDSPRLMAQFGEFLEGLDQA